MSRRGPSKGKGATSRTQLSMVLPTPDGFNAESLVGDLNVPQRQAVLANEGPVLVLAGAGSGKTRALTRKIACLVLADGYAPWEILAVTFTNKAAAEMRERCTELLGRRAKDLWLGTFHSIGVRMLRQHGERVGIPRRFVIYDSDDQLKMVKRCMQRVGISDRAFPPRGFQKYINTQKQQCRGPTHAQVPQDRPWDKRALQIFGVYEAAMREANAVEFGDLIYLPYRLLTEHREVAFEYQSRWRYVLVDEFQDTNRAQYAVLKAALNPDQRICVVGDDDQSIYGWRGADVSNILGFDKDFPGAKVFRLEQNYRSSRPILEVAGALISRNKERHPKTLWTDRDGGDQVRVYAAQSDRDEAEYVLRRIRELRGAHALGEMAIFYRTNAQSRVFEDRLRAHGLPYRVVGGLRFYDRAEVKDILAYLKALVNPSDVISMQRIINRPARRIGKTTIVAVSDYAQAREISFWEGLCSLARSGTTSQKKKLAPFVELMIELSAGAAEADAYAIVTRVLEVTKYLALLEAEDTLEASTRADNVKELVDAIASFVEAASDTSLAAFLDVVSLRSDLDDADLEEDAVIMMTAHTAKGLEYDVVFVTGLEEKLFPHANSSETAEGVEEERRLAYVAMTRARHQLHLTHAASRRRFGPAQPATRSRFLDGLPKEHLHHEGIRRTKATSRWSAEQRSGPRFEDDWSDHFSQQTPAYEDFNQDGGTLRVQGFVFHTKFGEGRVLEIQGTGDRAKVKVMFADGVTRRLLSMVLTPL